MILNYPMLENSTSFFPLHPIFVTFAKCFACLVFDLHFPTKKKYHKKFMFHKSQFVIFSNQTIVRFNNDGTIYCVW